LQEQNLLAAPLIVRTAADRSADEQEVVVLLHDFSFTPAEELLAGLLGGAGHGGAMGHGATGHGMNHGMGHETSAASAMDHGAMGGAMAMDLNDIEYDAYLANDRTLDDPEVHTVEKGGVVRLRIINGATSTAFTVELGRLKGELVAVDGQDVAPVRTSRIPLSMGQRADVRLRVPSEGGAFPVLFLREGARERTGIVLATSGAAIDRLATTGDVAGPVLGTEFEAMLSARRPLPVKAPDRSVMVHLTGDMASYRWAIAGAGDLVVRQGQRIEIAMMNMSMMAHPMHLHGHRFQVVGIDGRRMSGAVRDTVLIPPMRTVTVAVDADNPGRWAFHCHHLYHMASGMMAELAYEDVD
jgi:FtsP/CotA-like multicopper oxidase with cupredoxin domain